MEAGFESANHLRAVLALLALQGWSRRPKAGTEGKHRDAMAIEKLLGDMPTSVFIEDYYLRLPLAMPDRASHLVSLGSWATVEAILAQPGTDVLAAREGKLWEGEGKEGRKGGRKPEAPALSFDQARNLHASGYTVLIRHAEKHHERLAELAAGFEADFGAPVNVHIYCTPANRHGFGWHYDAEDVFVVQTAGSKQYSLRKNTVHPLPLVETIPGDMAFEREVTPTFECRLVGGDWLYIPAGYWHVATAEEDAISLAIGVMAPSAIEAYALLRGELLRSPLWRQRLPVAGRAASLGREELLARYREILTELGQDVARRMGDERFARKCLSARELPPAAIPPRRGERP